MLLGLQHIAPAQVRLTAEEAKTEVGDSPAAPGPLATGLSASLTPQDVRAAMRKVADWQLKRITNTTSRDWTFATLYLGLLASSETLQDARYRSAVLQIASKNEWKLGPREVHADDQAIGQVYLQLYKLDPRPERIEPLSKQFDAILQHPQSSTMQPIWWWCDALFMAPPVWAELARVTHDDRYLDYMDANWHETAQLLWDSEHQLFFRDRSYFDKREKNGARVFWSRGNGWVMGGLVSVLENMPAKDPRRGFYEGKFRQMAASVAAIQGTDGLWRPGLLDAANYANPEISGSAFFVYALAWGIEHKLLDESKYHGVVAFGWKGLLSHIYADGRLGSIQPVGEAPGAYTAGASYVFGTGAFLLAGSEVERLAEVEQMDGFPSDTNQKAHPLGSR